MAISSLQIVKCKHEWNLIKEIQTKSKVVGKIFDGLMRCNLIITNLVVLAYANRVSVTNNFGCVSNKRNRQQ